MEQNGRLIVLILTPNDGWHQVLTPAALAGYAIKTLVLVGIAGTPAEKELETAAVVAATVVGAPVLQRTVDSEGKDRRIHLREAFLPSWADVEAELAELPRHCPWAALQRLQREFEWMSRHAHSQGREDDALIYGAAHGRVVEMVQETRSAGQHIAIRPVPAGECTIYGVREPKPPLGFPAGRLRWRLRHNSFAEALVKTADGIRRFVVREKDGHWMPLSELGRNAAYTVVLPPEPETVVGFSGEVQL